MNGGRRKECVRVHNFFSITKLISLNFTMLRWHTPLLHSTHDRGPDSSSYPIPIQGILYTPTKHSKLCSLHFQPSDFVEEPQDTNVTRKRKKSKSCVKPFRRYLKEDAIPSIFSNAPSYLWKTCSVPRSTSRATTSSRLQLQEERLDNLEQSFMENDNISGLTVLELEERLRNETTVPQDFKICVCEQVLVSFYT